MLNIKFSRIIIIGYGMVTGEILQFVHENSVKYQYAVEYIEYEVHPFNQAKKYTESNGITYHRIQDKIELTSYFEAISDVTLIISASNNYLFTKELIEKSNITIINFHNALLPSYPGRNAPSWAIYEGQKKTGITWHYVTSGIDEGNIIIQKECEILPDMKAYELVSKLMSLSSEAFKECFQVILTENVSPVVQKIESGRKIYKASEVPGNGRFRVEDPPQDIYRLLRALDYGKNDIFPLPISEYQGNTIRIRRYKIVLDGNKREAGNIINIPYGEAKYLEIKFDLLYPDGSIGG